MVRMGYTEYMLLSLLLLLLLLLHAISRTGPYLDGEEAELLQEDRQRQNIIQWHQRLHVLSMQQNWTAHHYFWSQLHQITPC